MGKMGVALGFGEDEGERDEGNECLGFLLGFCTWALVGLK